MKELMLNSGVGATPRERWHTTQRMKRIRVNPASRKLHLEALVKECANVGHLGPVLTKDEKDKLEAMNKLKLTFVEILKKKRVQLAGEQEGLFGISMELEKEKGKYIVYHLGDTVLVDKPQSLGVPKKVSEAMATNGVQVTATVVDPKTRR
ncbi:MAG: hypothetical protein WC488_00635 [Candidatus Micrarchaeia archaeon]